MNHNESPTGSAIIQAIALAARPSAVVAADAVVYCFQLNDPVIRGSPAAPDAPARQRETDTNGDMKLAARIRLSLDGAALLAAGAVLLAAAAADAQTVIGNGKQSSVVVDYSVLEELGPAPNVPQVLMPGGRAFPPPAAGAPQLRFPVLPGGRSDSAAGRITLKPPEGVSPRRPAAKPAAKKRPRAQAKAAPKPKPAPPPAGAARAPEPIAPPPAPSPPAMASAPPPAPEPPPPAKAEKPPAMAAKPPEPAPAPPPAAAPPAPPEAAEPAPAPAPAKPPAMAKASPGAAGKPAGAVPIAPGESLRVGFEPGSAKLNPDSSRTLKRIADGMTSDDELRIQLLAYAGGTSETASQARRMSLSRALAARSFLIGEGVRSTRIDVRALGNKSEGGPPDRIDVIVTKR